MYMMSLMCVRQIGGREREGDREKEREGVRGKERENERCKEMP